MTPRAARRARDSADGARRTPRASTPPSACRSTRKRPDEHRHLGRRSRGDGAAPRSIRRPRPSRSGAARPHVSAARARPAACWCAPARPKRPSISRASPGSYPAGVICEIMNEDGTMARVPELAKFATQARAADDHDRRSDPVPHAHRVAREARRARRSCRPSTATSTIHAFENQIDRQTHVALVRGDIGDGKDVLVRVHS